jgi:hypothetical protein
LFDRGNVRNFRGEPYVPGGALTAVQAGLGHGHRQEVDLPARFTVVYQDLERDADIGTQYVLFV